MNTSTLNLILNIVMVLIGGGALKVIFDYRAKIRELGDARTTADRAEDRVEYQTLLDEVRLQRDEEKQRCDRLEERIKIMEAEISGLRLARDLDPFPHWIVDRSGDYLYVNAEFERYFLLPQGLLASDAVGKKHEDLGWPKAFCETLKALDAAARSRPDGTARAVTSLDVPEFGNTKVTVHKFPIRFKPSGVIVGYAGYITDIESDGRTIG